MVGSHITTRYRHGLVLIAEGLFGIVGARIGHSEVFRIELKYTEKTALNYVMRYCKNNCMMIRNSFTECAVVISSAYLIAIFIQFRVFHDLGLGIK